jgi:hypothetical protein
MNLSLDIEQASTAAITHHVNELYKNDYEVWLTEIIPVCKSYAGHLGVGVIRPVAGATTTYTVFVRFDTQANLLTWMHSEDRNKLVQKVQPYLAKEEEFQVKSGLDFWFTPEEVKAKLPTKWKQFLVTWSAIFPLVLGISALIEFILTNLSAELNHTVKIFVLTFFVVLMMVYVVMPRYTKLVHKWLFS